MMADEDLERRLTNWAWWYFSGHRPGGSSGGTVSSIYRQGPKPPRAETVMPIIDGEAMDTDTAIAGLPEESRVVLRACYLREGVRGERLGALLRIHEVARRIGCSTRTYYDRLAAAKARLRAEIELRRAALRTVVALQG